MKDDWNIAEIIIVLVIVLILSGCIGLVIWGEMPEKPILTQQMLDDEYECQMLQAERGELAEEEILELCQP